MTSIDQQIGTTGANRSGYLIVRLKGMGDIVHLLPSLAMLRRRHPKLPLGLLCQKPFGDLVPPELGIRLFQIPARADIHATLTLLRAIRRQRYAKLFDLFCNPRTALISFFSGIPERHGFSYRYRKWPYHRHFVAADANCHLMHLFGLFFAAFGETGPLLHPQVRVSISGREKAEELFSAHGSPRPLLAINQHTTYPSKGWPFDHFRSFIEQWFALTGQPVLLLHGPGELSATQRLLAAVGAQRAFLHDPLTLPELTALLARLDLLLTCDTGPMNLAWALGTRTVALFGPTTRRSVAPRGTQHLILHHPRLMCLECHRERCDDGRCMDEMAPAWVLQRIRMTWPNFQDEWQ